MKKINHPLIVFGLGPAFFFLASPAALARVEYAVKEKVNCASCHATPWGGGPRTVFGKTYGSRDLGVSKLSASDLYYADLRLIAYHPTDRATKTVDGIALMEAAVTGDVPVIQKDNGSEVRGVLTYNISSLAGSEPREAYVRFQLPTTRPEDATQITIGRFYVPFGLLTDEHRTYTLIQTNMTINNYDVGAAVSGNWTHDLHSDLAVVNDFQGGGTFTSGSITWGVVGNLRWSPSKLPFLIGVSGNYEYSTILTQPYASSVYAALSVDRLTEDKISGSLLLERVDAFHWNNSAVNTGQVNPGLNSFFFPGSDVVDPSLISAAPSFGYFVQAKYNINTQWTLMYKFDYLQPDKNSASSGFARHGIGFESFLNSNLILQVRFEKAVNPDLTFVPGTTLGTQDDIFAMLRLWI